MMETTIDEAHSHLEIAYQLLLQENLSERFFPLAVNVSRSNNSHFFYQFGADNGMQLSIERDSVGELILSFSVRRVRRRFLKRCKDAFIEAWSNFCGKETVHKITLANEDVTKFKDLLRNIK